MALVAINVDAVRDYSLQDDTSEDKTIFKIGQLDSFTRAYIDDEHFKYNPKDENNPFPDSRLHQKYLDIVKFGLRGWTNFKDLQGFDVEFKTEDKVFPIIGKRTVVSDESLKRLSLKWVIELGVQIVSDNTLTEEDKKK